MLDGLFDQAFALEPGARPPVEDGHQLGVGVLQLVAQEFGEKVMITVPPPGVVERNDEKVGMLELAQKLAGTLHLKDLVAKRSRQLLQHGGPDHETSLFLGNGGQDFLRKQVDYIATAASKRRNVGVRVPSPHGKGCEVDTRGPSLGALEQLGHVGTVDAEPQPLP